MGTFTNTVCWHVQLLCVIENLQPQFNFACACGVKSRRCKNLRPLGEGPWQEGVKDNETLARVGVTNTSNNDCGTFSSVLSCEQKRADRECDAVQRQVS